MMPCAHAFNWKRQAGFSLVELMASALILGITISGVMAMIGSGRDYELGKELRRQAGIIAHSALEDTNYHYSKFSTIPSTSQSNVTVTLNTTAADISGTLGIAVSVGNMVLPRYSGGVVNVPYKTVVAKVRWVGTQADSVSVLKRVVKARP